MDKLLQETINFDVSSPDNGKIKDLILDSLHDLSNRANNELYSKIVNCLMRLNYRDKFKITFNSKLDDEISTYGYYSAYDNTMHLIVNKNDFGRKWFGLITDYDAINTKSIDAFMSTCAHELMHFCCTNYYEKYIAIWKDTMYKHLWTTYNILVNTALYSYIDNNNYSDITPKKFLEDPLFKKTFDAYFNSLLINVQFRLRTFIKRYNDILSTMYSKFPFKYARFFDNVIISGSKLPEGIFKHNTIALYKAIKEAYYILEPELKNVKINSLFYQEVLDLSEISCIFATYYQYAPKYQKMVYNTLSLIN